MCRCISGSKGGLTHEAFLYELVRGECEQRDQRRTARLLRQSGLPLDTLGHGFRHTCG